LPTPRRARRRRSSRCLQRAAAGATPPTSPSFQENALVDSLTGTLLDDVHSIAYETIAITGFDVDERDLVVKSYTSAGSVANWYVDAYPMADADAAARTTLAANRGPSQLGLALHDHVAYWGEGIFDGDGGSSWGFFAKSEDGAGDARQVATLDAVLSQQIAVEGDTAYVLGGPYTGATTIWAIPLVGGAPRVLATANAISGFALRSSVAYWIEPTVDAQGHATGGALRSRALAGGDVATLPADVGSASGLTVSSRTIYWAREGAPSDADKTWRIESMPIAGGPVTLVASGATTVPPALYSNGTGWMVWGIPNVHTRDAFSYGPMGVHVVCD
jgi:hypothetical protein